MKLKHIAYLIMALMFSLNMNAQSNKKFDPVKFEASLEQFVVEQSELSQKESAAFLPLWREMRKKQVSLMEESRKYRHLDINNDKKCEEAIRHHDNVDIRMKELQKNYHNKFLKVLPATKVVKIIRAEERFHRQAFKRAVDRKKRR